MKYILSLLLLSFALVPCFAYAQDAQPSSKSAPVAFDLDEEKMEIEADIPSVDLILSFRAVQEKNHERAQSFLKEIVESAKHDPF